MEGVEEGSRVDDRLEGEKQNSREDEESEGSIERHGADATVWRRTVERKS